MMACESELRGYTKVRITVDVCGWPVGSIVWHDGYSAWDDDCTKSWSHTIGKNCEVVARPHFKIGQRYTQANGREVTCIALRDDGGMWAVVEMESTAAYAWDKDGNYLSCLPGTGDNWKIIFPPVIERRTVIASVDYKDGVPDWASAEVVE